MILASFLAAVAVVAAPALPADSVDDAVGQLRDGPGVYLAPSADGQPLSSSDADQLAAAVRDAGTPIYVAALGESSAGQARADLRRLVDGVGREGTYVVVAAPNYVVASDVPGVDGQTSSLKQQAHDAHPGEPLPQLEEFVRLVDAAAGSGSAGSGSSGDVPAGEPSTSSHRSSPFVPLLVLLALGGGLVALVRRGNARRRRTDGAAFAEVRTAADQDVTALGEQLTALDVPPAAAPDAVADYQQALDAYDRSKSALAAARRPDDLRAVTLALEEGRWRLACVRARLAGQPLPERRPPCFFNPQHGPSTTDVSWAPPGGAPREVPVCAADAERVARGQQPDERMVAVGGGTMPYWQAPAYYRPYASGFFGGWGGGSFLGGLLLGEMLTGGFGGGWGAYDAAAYDQGYDAGYDQGVDAGGGDGDFASGFDVSDGGWGGGGSDWGGGGDFGGGGGDWGGGGDFGGGGGDGGW